MHCQALNGTTRNLMKFTTTASSLPPLSTPERRRHRRRPERHRRRLEEVAAPSRGPSPARVLTLGRARRRRAALQRCGRRPLVSPGFGDGRRRRWMGKHGGAIFSFLFSSPPTVSSPHREMRERGWRPKEMAAPPRASSPVRACTRGCAHGRRVAPRWCLFAPPPSVAGVNDGRRRGKIRVRVFLFDPSDRLLFFAFLFGFLSRTNLNTRVALIPLLVLSIGSPRFRSSRVVLFAMDD
jgi:hypothetical protein